MGGRLGVRTRLLSLLLFAGFFEQKPTSFCRLFAVVGTRFPLVPLGPSSPILSGFPGPSSLGFRPSPPWAFGPLSSGFRAAFGQLFPTLSALLVVYLLGGNRWASRPPKAWGEEEAVSGNGQAAAHSFVCRFGPADKTPLCWAGLSGIDPRRGLFCCFLPFGAPILGPVPPLAAGAKRRRRGAVFVV